MPKSTLVFPVLAWLSVLGMAWGDLMSLLAEKEQPRYKVVATGDDYELREYKPATWVGTNLTGLGFDGASFLGEKALIQYFKGGNTEKLYINVTTPLFLDFLPAFDEAGTPNGTVQFYTLWLLLPRAIWDDPPEPTAPIGFPTPEVLAVKYFWTYTRTFSGFAFESNVLKQIQKLNETLLADGVDTSQPGTGWVFSRYSPDVSGPPNEIHYSGAGRAPKHLLDKASRR
eukprot:jgi/Botrbrau1/2342/Bobra.39_1s0031.2